VKSETSKALELLGNVVHKVLDTKEREEKAEQPFSLSAEDGADALEKSFISPEVMRKFGIRYSTEEWPPQRRQD
jgi:hypothetical protein